MKPIKVGEEGCPAWVCHPDGLTFGEGVEQVEELSSSHVQADERIGIVRLVASFVGAGPRRPQQHGVVAAGDQHRHRGDELRVNVNGCLCCGGVPETDWSLEVGPVTAAQLKTWWEAQAEQLIFGSGPGSGQSVKAGLAKLVKVAEKVERCCLAHAKCRNDLNFGRACWDLTQEQKEA